MDILLATSLADLRLSLEMLLGQEPGVRIVGTASETAGLRALVQTTRPDIVVADWDLPGNPVAELIAEAAAGEGHPSFIVLSSRESAKQAVLASGADAFIFKGEAPDTLLKAFRQIRQQGGLAASPEA